jgi:hypothetical protein
VKEKARQTLSVSKQAAQKFYMEKFNFKKLNDVEVKELWTSRGLGKVLEHESFSHKESRFEEASYTAIVAESKSNK